MRPPREEEPPRVDAEEEEVVEEEEEADVVDVGAFEGTVDPVAVDPAAVDPAAVDPAARNVSMEDPPLDGDGDDDVVDRNRTPDPSELELEVVEWNVVEEDDKDEDAPLDAPLAAKPREVLTGAVFAVEPSLGVREDDAEEGVGLET